MKFHGVHGSNVTIDEGGSRASRVSSFCDGITFSHKPLSINSRVSIFVGANEDWTGALRIGVTSQDPNHNKKLPRYLCPDLTSKPGYWARPLPESWVVNGNRLTFYVNGRGHFHLFINNDHKGAILTGLPTKEQLWIVLDLYGITVSVKFVSNSGTAPTEVVARGPEAVQAYQHALTHGSTPYYHTRIAIIGPSDDKKTVLKKSFLKICDLTEPECEGIDTTCFCQTTERSIGQPWTWLRLKNRFSVEDNDNNQFENSDEINGNNSDKREEDSHLVIYGDEEYFKAMAINIVREMILQKKKDDRKKTAVSKNGFRLQSSLSKIGSSRAKLDEVSNSKELICTQEGLPEDLPMRVIELVEALLKESDCKILAEKKEKQSCENLAITFNVWNYSGHIKYLFLHQLFLSPQTIYVFVFDLSEDLDAPILKAEDYGFEFSSNDCLSYLSLLHIWLELVYVSIAYPKEEHKNSTEENIINDIVCTLFPPILIVGVQEDSTTFDSVVETQFNKIKESIQDKVYYHLVHPTFYYVGSPDTMAVDSMISELREKIQELALQMPHFGMEIPLKWMLFEQAIDRLVEREVYFADICKLFEVARLEGIDCEEEFHSMIHFYHHHGKIWHLTSDRHQNNENCSVVILKPQWFINYVYKLLSEESYILCKEYFELHEHNKKMFTSEIFDNIWPNAFHHVNILLSMLDSTDVLSLTSVENSDNEKLIESLNVGIPWLVEDKLDTSSNFNFDCLVLILDFSGLLPVGLFTKLMVRLFRWSSRHDWKGNSNNRKNEIPIDYNHSIKLQKIHGHRIQVVITQKNYLETEEEVNFSYPSPHICSKVRHLLERETEYLCDVWYKRLSFSLNIPCPCAKSCKLHTTIKCTDYQCIHLLPLNECLIKKVIECDYRLVKTDFIQKYFFSASIEGDFTKCSESMQLTMDSITVPFWNEQDVIHEDLPWMTCVGKMLTCANTGHDWIALARRLSYSEREIKRFEEETVPPISLLNNWINSNGRTRYCIDLLISCLEQMGRQDVANYISVELGQPDLPSPPVFISYQWDSQEAVLQLRKRIELAGYSCWMDVGHMLGGDALYGKIYEGINKSKVVLCCLTPRYVLSPLCTREMSLADVLRKPIVPIILESTPWPPPGALALILSSLVYVDLCGIGGHGGNGKQADWESRFSSIIERLSHFISPSFISPPLSNMPSERHAPPTIIRNPEEFLDALEQSDEQEVLETMPLPDGDSVSESVSIPDPTVWEPPHRNRVIRCSVCVLL